MVDANQDLQKLQAKFEKRKANGVLTDVETSEFEVKITKKQLKIKEIEEDIVKAQKKLADLN